MYMRIVGFVFY